MRSLSLLLRAAVGVNAVLGSHIEAIVISGDSYACASDCTFRGLFLGVRAACLEEKAIISVVKETGEDYVNLNTGSAFICTGEPELVYATTRQPTNGETPKQCFVFKYSDPSLILCASNKQSGGPGGEVMQWLDVEKLLEPATGQCTPQRNSSQTTR